MPKKAAAAVMAQFDKHGLRLSISINISISISISISIGSSIGIGISVSLSSSSSLLGSTCGNFYRLIHTRGSNACLLRAFLMYTWNSCFSCVFLTCVFSVQFRF